MALSLDNATTHHACTSDALTAWYMSKQLKLWLSGANSKQEITRCKMHQGKLSNGQPQDFWYLNDHLQYLRYFKEMTQILIECGFTAEAKLNVECKNFWHKDPKAACCCH